MQSSQLTALQNAKLLLEQCGCFRGPPGPTGPQGPEGPAGKTLFYYSDGVTNDPNSGNIDGCIYGLFIGADGTIWRSQATTQIDSSFTASYLNGPVNTITKQADGKILVGGAFTLYGASSYNYLIRFNSDGTVDTSFSIGTGFDNSVETVVVQPDGKILVGGAFTLYNGNFYKNLVRLNSDGSLDTGFYSTPGFDNTVYSIALQSDGKIVVGGQFENYDTVQSYKLIRLTSAGFYDASFPVDTGFDGVVYSVVLDSDNNVYVGGNFSSYRSSPISNGLVRILNDSTLDTTIFLTGTGVVGTVYFMRLINSSTLLITGNLSSYNGTSINNLAEISINGTVTNTFGAGINGVVNVGAVDLSSNYLFGGSFSSYNGTSVPTNIVRITSLGNVDTTYPFVTGFNNTVNSIYVENYSQLLVGGDFTQYNNSTTSYLTRLQEKPCAWINTGTNILGASSNYSTVTNALVSTVAGLGNAGYISSSQLISTVTGLGSIGYVSSSQLVSSVAGLTNFISTYISSSQLTSTVIGIAVSSFVSSINLDILFSSTINGLGNLGYISTSQLVSTVRGLGTVGYVSSTQLASTVAGLSQVGYISTSQLISTINSLARLGYVSSSQLASTVTGLGTVRYVSSTQLTSTVRGLGTVGYVSTQSLYSTIESYNFISTQSLTSTTIGLGSLGYISSAGSLQAGLTSSIIGLGTVGYVSTQSLYSTIESYNFISTPSLTSTTIGLGSLGYISSAGSLQAGLTSSIIGLGTVGYLSSFNTISSLNISTGNLFANIINSSTVINTDGIFTISLSTGQTLSRLVNSSSISTSVLLGDRIIGTSNNGVYVNNIYPFSAGAQLGFGSGLTGFYAAVFTQSTVTNSLTADFGNPNSNIGVTGNIIPAFSSFTNASLGNNTNRWVNIFNNNLVVSTISTFLSSITVSGNFIPSRDNQFTLGTSTLRWRSLFVGPSSIYVGDIAEINANDSGVLTTNVGFEIPQLNVSSISSGGVAVFTNISSLVYGGIESYQYISTTGLQSTITGLGSLGYISSAGSLQEGLTSSIVGLGTVGYISTQSLYSTIESYNFISTTTLQSSIIGLGSIGYLSTVSLISSIDGLATIGYISSSQLQSTVTAARTMIIQTFIF